MIEIKHPSIEMQRQNFSNFNGEDIELANRELAKSQKSTKGRSEVFFFFFLLFLPSIFRQMQIIVINYRLLGLMWLENKRFIEEIKKKRSLRGILDQNKRRIYKDPIQLHQVQFIFLV